MIRFLCFMTPKHEDFFAACGADLKKISFNRDYASEFQEKQYPVQLFSSKQPESARVTAASASFSRKRILDGPGIPRPNGLPFPSRLWEPQHSFLDLNRTGTQRATLRKERTYQSCVWEVGVPRRYGRSRCCSQYRYSSDDQLFINLDNLWILNHEKIGN